MNDHASAARAEPYGGTTGWIIDHIAFVYAAQLALIAILVAYGLLSPGGFAAHGY